MDCLGLLNQEANAESKYLNGLGIARERKAIVEGLKGSVEEFSHNVEGTSPRDVMDLILLTQYFGKCQKYLDRSQGDFRLKRLLTLLYPFVLQTC